MALQLDYFDKALTLLLSLQHGAQAELEAQELLDESLQVMPGLGVSCALGRGRECASLRHARERERESS